MHDNLLVTAVISYGLFFVFLILTERKRQEKVDESVRSLHAKLDNLLDRLDIRVPSQNEAKALVINEAIRLLENDSADKARQYLKDKLPDFASFRQAAIEITQNKATPRT